MCFSSSTVAPWSRPQSMHEGVWVTWWVKCLIKLWEMPCKRWRFRLNGPLLIIFKQLRFSRLEWRMMLKNLLLKLPVWKLKKSNRNWNCIHIFSTFFLVCFSSVFSISKALLLALAKGLYYAHCYFSLFLLILAPQFQF